MLDFLRNTFLNRNRYKTNSEAVIISCFFNPENSAYRLLAFQKFYTSIKHLNHRIIECVIGDGKPQLPESPYITRIHTDSLLWHKEVLLNKIISELPPEFKYVFWLDADVLFTNQNWLVDSCEALKTACVVQPFEYCVHLDKNQVKPSFDTNAYKVLANTPNRHAKMWRSFCSNMVPMQTAKMMVCDHTNYDLHGHVGFAWGARREVLEECPLYDRCLIGGADHIIAHALNGKFDHPCIANAFKDDLDDVVKWMKKFHAAVQKQGGIVSYAKGDLYHIWHGDIDKRQYLKRIKDFTKIAKDINQRDKNGLYVAKGDNAYMKNYFRQREVLPSQQYYFDGFDDGFYEEMGYHIQDIIYYGTQLYLQSQQQWQDDQAQQYENFQIPTPEPFDMPPTQPEHQATLPFFSSTGANNLDEANPGGGSTMTGEFNSEVAGEQVILNMPTIERDPEPQAEMLPMPEAVVEASENFS